MTWRRATAGVSQLEALIALAVMGLISVVLANALGFAGQMLRRSLPLSEEVPMLMARDTLRGWAADIPLRRAGWTGQPLFSGSSAELNFLTLISDERLRATEPASVSLYLENGELRAKASGYNQAGAPVSKELLLDENVLVFSLRYFGKSPQEEPARWYESWQEPLLLPDLIKAEWQTAEGSSPPPLILQPGLAQRESQMSLHSILPDEKAR